MVVSVDNEGKPEASTEKPKRRSTAAQQEASRRNGRKGRGPVTQADIDISKYNGIRHGLACQTADVVLPGEDPRLLERKAQLWAMEAGATTDLELTQVWYAVDAWALGQRVKKAIVGATTRIINQTHQTYHESKQREAETLGAAIPGGENLQDVLFRLRSSSDGCTYLQKQWNTLAEHLKDFDSLSDQQRVLAIHLCGRRCDALYRDPVVAAWTRAYLAASQKTNVVTVATATALLIDTDRPASMGNLEFSEHIAFLIEKLPTVEQGHATLVALVAERIAELSERRSLIALREKEDLGLAVQESMSDVTHDGKLRHRYSMDHQRAHESALRGLRVLIEHRMKYGPELEAEEDETDEDAGVAAAAPGTREVENRTEPGAAQVVVSRPAEERVESPPRPGVLSRLGAMLGSRPTPAATPTPAPPAAPATAPAVAPAPAPSRDPKVENRTEPGATQAPGVRQVRLPYPIPPEDAEIVRQMAREEGLDEEMTAELLYGLGLPGGRPPTS